MCRRKCRANQNESANLLRTKTEVDGFPVMSSQSIRNPDVSVEVWN